MSCDGDVEPCDVWRETKHRARKEHTCSACGETIERTHFYVAHFSLFEGEVQTLKRCMRCETIYSHLMSLCESDCPPMPKLNCGHSYEEVHGGEPPPDHIAALAFALPGEIQ